jgi:hypothetical protein
VVEVSEEKREAKLRFIKEEPWISQILRTFRPIGIIPEDLHNWFWDWVQDIGAAMRSRDMMVGFAASIGYYAIAVGLFSLLESVGVTPGAVKRLKGLILGGRGL